MADTAALSNSIAYSGQVLQIQLPEGVIFSLPLGGPISRMFAFILDATVIAVLSSTLGKVAQAVSIVSADFSVGFVILLYFGVYFGYGVACEFYWRGQTIGKWLVKLRVADATGMELQLTQVAIRNVLRLIDMMPFFGLVGGVTMLLNRRLQRLGDIAAGTVVLKSRHTTPPNLEALLRGRYNSFLAHKILCARLRQRTPPVAGGIAVEALLRRDSLEDRERVRLFDDLAGFFRSLVEFPSDETDQLTSEQYVRNVVEVLYMSR